MTDDPFDDIKKLRHDPAEFKQPPVPTKIKKRLKAFGRVPMTWHEALKAGQPATGLTVLIAIYLCYLDFEEHGKPFTLANGMLEYDGISRQTKWRALRELERRGLITIECRRSKSPVIHMLQMNR
jgi:hypothetical protein